MRIIAGKHRGRKLLGPKDETTTRPITDRIKEILFNRLMSLGFLGEGNVLDIFAGTGSMGLECLSRGADHCVFVERDHDARSRLEQNIDALDLKQRSRIIASDAYSPSHTGQSTLPSSIRPTRIFTMTKASAAYRCSCLPCTNKWPKAGSVFYVPSSK